MSMKRTVILTAVSTSNHARNKTQPDTFDAKKAYRNSTNYDGGLSVNLNDNVNVVLAGAMLSVLTALVCILCYFCNKSINKRSMAIYRQRWMESVNDPNMGIYSVEQFYDSTTSQNTVPCQGEPPSYDAVMKLEQKYSNDKYLMDNRFFPTCQNCGSVQLKSVPYTKSLLDDGMGPEYVTEQETTKIRMACENGNAGTIYGPDANGNELVLANNFDQEPGAQGECPNSTANAQSDNGGANIPFDENSNMNVENFSRLPDTSTSEACRSVERCENCAGSISTPTDAQPNTDDIDHLNGNGIVRMDMSKIIDSTGLPTYDAALKLESCGYV